MEGQRSTVPITEDHPRVDSPPPPSDARTLTQEERIRIGAKDLGWTNREEDIPNMTDGLNNEELWMLIRRSV